jgi:hypothetical protein
VPKLSFLKPRKLEDTEGEVFLGIEGEDNDIWHLAVELYRLLRRMFIGRGRAGRPGEISWKIINGWLQEDPEEYSHYLEMFYKRKLRRWEKRWGSPEPELGWTNRSQRLTEEKEAYRLARQEMKRGLARVRRLTTETS